MKIYKYTDGSATIEWKFLPDPFLNTTPMTDELFIEKGGVIEEVVTPEEQEFYAACSQFRQVCAMMGEFLHKPDFKGGFDEYISFATSPEYAANPVMGNSLAIQWSGTNEFCKYTGSKIGLGQPEWWYRCWELANQENPSENNEEETPVEESNESNDSEVNEEENSDSSPDDNTESNEGE